MEEYNESQSERKIFEGARRIPRATQAFLKVIAHPPAPRPNVERVRIEPEPRSVLMTMLERVGTHRGGPLFGSYLEEGGVVFVTDAAHRGYDTIPHSPYTWDSSYLLGWSDCLSQYGSNDVDWVGYWAVDAMNEMPSSLAQDFFVRSMGASGLVTEQFFLMFIGVEGEQVVARAYLLIQGQATEIPVEFV